MDFLKIIQSLDELLYELMSWLVFYPVTLWRTLVHPLRMMDYSDLEQGEAEASQYTDTLSPPLFLMLTLLLAHLAQLSLIGEDEIVASNKGLSALISDETSLLTLNLATFSLIPLLLAVRLVRAQKLELNRDTLRAPFYSQCYAVAPLALTMNLLNIGLHLPVTPVAVIGILTVFVAAWSYFGWLQALWYAHHLQCGKWMGFLNASRALFECVIALVVVGALFD